MKKHSLPKNEIHKEMAHLKINLNTTPSPEPMDTNPLLATVESSLPENNKVLENSTTNESFHPPARPHHPIKKLT